MAIDTQKDFSTLLNLEGRYQAGLGKAKQGLRNLMTSFRPPFGSLYVSSSAATTIATQDVYVKAAGTTAAIGSNAHLITPSTSNRLTYTGTSPRNFIVTGTLSYTHAAVGAIIVGVKIAKNGTVIDSSRVQVTTANAVTGTLSVIADVELTEDDYVEAWVANHTATDNITVTHMVLTATGSII
jgi:hypothetical protein